MATIDFVYNVLEISYVSLKQCYLNCLLLSPKMNPLVYINKILAEKFSADLYPIWDRSVLQV